MMQLDDLLTPSPAFYFSVHFMVVPPMVDLAFFEVSGLAMEMETEELQEGGWHARQIPKTRKSGRLICKRPVRPVAFSLLSTWTAVTMESEYAIPIVNSAATVMLLDADGIPTCTWMLTGIYPVKWDISPFGSTKNEIVLETIEFAYDNITRII